MQVLTAQYPTMYTRKFRVFYTDFVSASQSFVNLTLFATRKGEQVISVMTNTVTTFIGTGVTTASLRIHASDTMAATATTGGSFANVNMQAFAGPSNGVLQSAIARTGAGTFVGQPVIGSVSASYNIVAQLAVNSPIRTNVLTQGEADIWVTTIRLP